MDHAAQLLDALHIGTIHRKDDIMFLQPSFSGGRILIDHGHFHALLVF